MNECEFNDRFVLDDNNVAKIAKLNTSAQMCSREDICWILTHDLSVIRWATYH